MKQTSRTEEKRTMSFIRGNHLRIRFPYLFMAMAASAMVMILIVSRKIDFATEKISISTDQLIELSLQASTLSSRTYTPRLRNLSLSVRRSSDIIKIVIGLALGSFKQCHIFSEDLLQEVTAMARKIPSERLLNGIWEIPPQASSEDLDGMDHGIMENLPHNHHHQSLTDLQGVREKKSREQLSEDPTLEELHSQEIMADLHSRRFVEENPHSLGIRDDPPSRRTAEDLHSHGITKHPPHIQRNSKRLHGFTGDGISENLPIHGTTRGRVVLETARDHYRGFSEILPSLKAALCNCEYLLRRSVHVMSRCHGDFASSATIFTDAMVKDIEAWMSGVLSWGNDCYSALSHAHNDYRSSQGASQDSGFDQSVYPNHKMMDQVIWLMNLVSASINLTTDALSMVDAYDTYGGDVRLWRPPSKSTVPGTLLFGKGEKDIPRHIEDDEQYTWDVDRVCGLVPNVVVSIEGNGDYVSIQAAVDDAPDNSTQRYVIYIKRGVYNETVRIPFMKTFLMFIGDGMEETVITGNRNAQQLGITTYDSATMAVDGDGFLACDLMVENTASMESHQAVALRVGSDLSQFYRCAFLGNQDTLYVHSLRQFYKGCRIEGTIDFIFGNAAAVFYECEVLVRPGRITSSIITAQGRTDPAQTTGIVFERCVINGTKKYMAEFESKPSKLKVYLGRPWKMYSRTVYSHCVLERFVSPEGWRPWKGDFALDTLFYGEFSNTGLGAETTHRVKWSQQMSSFEAVPYSLSKFIQGEKWLSAMIKA